MEAAPLALPAPVIHVTHRYVLRRVLFGFFLASLLAVGIAVISPTPQVRSLDAENLQPLDTPLVLEFQWPVSRTIDFRITPHVEGQVHYAHAVVGNRLTRSLIFTPEQTWLPGQTYAVTLSGVQSAVGFFNQQEEFAFTLQTTPAPVVRSITPALSNAVVADGVWTVTFDRPLTEDFRITAKTDPATDVRVTPSADGLTAIFQPTPHLGQGKQYALTIDRAVRQFAFGTDEVAHEAAPEHIFTGSWFVREPPGIQSLSPTGTGVSLDTTLTIGFAEPVDFSSVVQSATLTPAVAGEWAALDERTVTFTPAAALDKATTYTLVLAEGLRTKAGGIFNEDIRLQFRTREPIAFAELAPAEGAKGVDVSRQLRLTFNQPVNHQEVLQRVRLSPKVAGTWAWSGDALTFTPTSRYAYETTYTVTIAKDLSAPKGFPPAADLRATFTTELSTTRLAVPFHRQEHNLSCEAATLVMALRYRGLDVSEAQIIERIGIDPTSKRDGVWGDPDVAFVGDIDGQQPGTGYGVHTGPIVRVGGEYRPARTLVNASLADVLAEVQRGNPVIVWGNASTGKRIDWKTPTGKTVRAITGEHTRVVIGFVGSASKPTTIITLDPLSGEKRFSRSAFLTDWAYLGNLAVVVE